MWGKRLICGWYISLKSDNIMLPRKTKLTNDEWSEPFCQKYPSESAWKEYIPITSPAFRAYVTLLTLRVTFAWRLPVRQVGVASSASHKHSASSSTSGNDCFSFLLHWENDVKLSTYVTLLQWKVGMFHHYEFVRVRLITVCFIISNPTLTAVRRSAPAAIRLTRAWLWAHQLVAMTTRNLARVARKIGTRKHGPVRRRHQGWTSSHWRRLKWAEWNATRPLYESKGEVDV